MRYILLFIAIISIAVFSSDMNMSFASEIDCVPRLYIPTNPQYGSMFQMCKQEFEKEYKEVFTTKCYSGSRIHIMNNNKKIILIEMDNTGMGISCDGTENGNIPGHGKQGA